MSAVGATASAKVGTAKADRRLSLKQFNPDVSSCLSVENGKTLLTFSVVSRLTYCYCYYYFGGEKQK